MPENTGVPQFQTAEFHEQPAKDACCVCHQPIASPYYRIAGAMACASCAAQVAARKPVDSHAAFSRAVLFGIGGAIAGLILYSAVGIILHLAIGWVSLAVGWLVARAMMKGSGNIGGRRYQVVAVLLTYIAVSMSAVPVAIAYYIQERPHEQAKVAAPAPQKPPAVAESQAKPAAPPQSDVTVNGNEPAPEQASPMGLGKALGLLLAIGLGSPFLTLSESPFNGLIGLFILFIGMRIAWQITAGLRLPAVEGPY